MLELLKENKSNPVVQLAGILALMLLFMLIGKLTEAEPGQRINPTGAWEVMTACVLFFTLVNCVFSLQAKALSIYFRNSIYCFIGLLILGGLMSYGFSGVSIENAGSIKWILIVFCISYLVFLSIVNLMRFIVDLAQKQDSKLRGEE